MKIDLRARAAGEQGLSLAFDAAAGAAIRQRASQRTSLVAIAVRHQQLGAADVGLVARALVVAVRQLAERC